MDKSTHEVTYTPNINAREPAWERVAGLPPEAVLLWDRPGYWFYRPRDPRDAPQSEPWCWSGYARPGDEGLYPMGPPRSFRFMNKQHALTTGSPPYPRFSPKRRGGRRSG